jgi:hypothetical protein
MALTDNDWAIVAGVAHYPDLGNLDGPENDAIAFHEWVVNKAGVPPAQAKRILSSDFAPFADTALEAKPTCERIEEQFDALCAVAEENANKGIGEKVGRRLYIYLAGHGCTPSGDEAALLMANATRRRVYHVPGRPYANWFLRAGYFDEVVLFMDCCRERYPQAPIRVLPYVDLTDPSSVDRSKVLYGFATKWSRLSREKRMPDGKVRGVFSTALMTGLNGAAADEQGEITARSLADYLYNHMKRLLTPEELRDDDIPKEPELVYDTNPNARFVLAQTAPPRYPVRIHLPDTEVGKKIVVLDSKFTTAAEGQPKGRDWETSLGRGLYLAQVQSSGRMKPFEVTGLGDVDVQL